jgi:hypothetical protein
MHAVDIENQFGGTAFTAAATAQLVAIYPRLDREHDQVVLGASCSATAFEGGRGWGGARLVCRHGHDGADLALADVLLNENIENRFDRVIIGSGDGLFAPIAAHLAALGVEVGVVARRGHLSAALRLAVAWVEYLPEEPFLQATAVALPTFPASMRSAA